MKESVGRKLPLFRFNIVWGLLVTVPLAVAEMLLALYIQPNSFKELCVSLMNQRTLAFLNFLPFWLLTLGFLFLFSNPFFAAVVTGGIGGALSLVSRTMIEKRDEPLTPKDFALLKEAGDAMQSYSMDVHLPSLLVLLAFVTVMVLLGILFCCRRPFHVKWGNICTAFVGAVVPFCVLVGCIFQVYSSKELYNSFPVENRSYITSVFNELGFPYCFCYNFTTYQVEKPAGFSAKEAAAYTDEYPETAGTGDDVNVIMVMCEAFSDITNSDVFDYKTGEEPLKFYNSLKNSDRAITGHIVVPNFGAGTANTEFDVITGMQTNMIGESGVSSFRVLNHDIDSIFRVYAEDGYQTEFIHPGQNWFYNRQNVYKYFGADKLLFADAFGNAKRKGSWITDSSVLEVMKQEFETAMQLGQPYFNYTVTIQNHMSYTEKKYGDTVIPQVPLKTEVSDESMTKLSVYAEGARDGDTMLQGLTEYYDTREEPIVLVFFGDHRPNLGDNYLAYSELGLAIGESTDVETTLYTYETPYVIWVNEPAAEMLDFKNRRDSLDLPDNNTINANYLGAVTLELTGRRDQNSFFSFLNDMRREVPVLRKTMGKTADGSCFDTLPDAISDDVRKLRFWQYYRLKVE